MRPSSQPRGGGLLKLAHAVTGVRIQRLRRRISPLPGGVCVNSSGPLGLIYIIEPKGGVHGGISSLAGDKALSGL